MRLVMAVVIALAGCATLATGQPYSEDEMMTAAAALTKVTAAAEGNLRYGSLSDLLSDTEFLAQSVAYDPELVKPLAAYQIKATRQGGHVVILVCSQDGATALLEDAGCTAAMDRHRWRDDPMTACVFTINIAQLCPAAPM